MTARLWCPSGTPDAPESVVLGVHAGPTEDLGYLDSPVPAKDVTGLFPPDIDPARVLRFASHCRDSCAHRRGTECSLISRITALGDTSDDHTVPQCHLRPRCKWWDQAGLQACRRCPFVTRAARADDPRAVLIADPDTTQEQLDAYIDRTSRTREREPTENDHL